MTKTQKQILESIKWHCESQGWTYVQRGWNRKVLNNLESKGLIEVTDLCGCAAQVVITETGKAA